MTTGGADVVLLVDDGLGIAEQLAPALAARGGRPVLLGAAQVDLADGAAVTAEVGRVRGAGGPIRGVVHLASVAGGPDLEAGLDAWRAGLRRQVTSLFHVARAVQHDVVDDPRAWLLAVTGLGGDPVTAADAGGGGVAGLTRALAEEAACTVRLLHLPSRERRAAEDADTVLRELDRMPGDPALEVGYADGRRLRPAVTAAPLASPPVRRLPDRGVFLLTGGARGITAHAAHELASPGSTLVLVGRSAGPTVPEHPDTAVAADPRTLRATLVETARAVGTPVDLAAVGARATALLADREARATIASLRAAGATVDYRAADLREEDQVVALLDDVRSQHGPLDGVVHGAGVLDDRLLRDKSAASFDQVFHTKADSAYLLARHLDPQRLRFLVLFGSVAGRFGNAGQVDYAAANEVLAALARRLDAAWPGRVVAMCWGPWAGGGMVTPELERRFLERGVEPLAPVLGRRLFREELERGPDGTPVVVLGRGPWGVDRGVRTAMPLVPVAGEPATFDMLLDPANDGYLDDHRLDGVPVLPAAMAAELLAEAAELAHPGLVVTGLDDLAMLQGVVLANGPVRVRIMVEALEPLADGAGRCRTALGRPGRPGWSYRASAVLAPAVTAIGDDPTATGSAAPPEPPAVGAAYDDLLFHGPRFRGLESVDADQSGWLAAVHGAAPERFTSASPGGSWVLDPSLLDLGPQLAILWSRAGHGTTPLPVRFTSIRRGPAVGGLTGLTLRFVVRPGDDAAWQVADFEVRNPDGTVRLAVSGLEAAGTAALNRLTASGAAR